MIDESPFFMVIWSEITCVCEKFPINKIIVMIFFI